MHQTEDGLTKIDVQMCDETVWFTREQMAELFQRDRSVIGKHIKNIFDEGELRKESVWAKFAHTAEDGKVYQVDCYNLDVTISVGYRVESLCGTQFRIWGSSVLKEYLIKGFAMNDELLKKQAVAEKIYFSADNTKPYMGLYSFSRSHPTQADALVAKNYCNQEELEAFSRIVSSYLEFTEMQARRHILIYMKDWIETLDEFLKLSKHDILTGAGRILAVKRNWHGKQAEQSA